ncbi:Hypothetical predicted protein [Mytilus galloprovincialis]|uniref:Uncharacterized protein n=1 Tax=Mytilus galloprovincialis TaxID=29158 RepID=A0A8B6CX04_MYTGA|nr:Hypothetical predicted protein [Mytilus galloprovincialis]
MSIINADTYHKCGECCKCLLTTRGYKTAICNGSYIPKLPVSVEEIELRNSKLNDIGRFSLINIRLHNVYVLVLSGNSIRYIHEEAFVNLTLLAVLTVNNETSLSVDVLKKALTKLSSKFLKTLRFTNNNWEYIPNDMFDSFVNATIQNVHLIGNQFSDLNGSAFRVLTFCQNLVIEYNKLSKIIFWNMQRLKRLGLEGNRLAKVPNFCGFHDILFPKLKILSLSENNIGNIDNTSFICLPKLEVLKMRGISIVELQSNVFSSLKKLKEVNLEKINTLKRIENFAFNNTSLKKIYMPNCKLRFDLNERFNHYTIFKFCPNVNYVNLGLNHLPNNASILHSKFKPLDNLRSLLLHSTGLIDLPRNLFTN